MAEQKKNAQAQDGVNDDITELKSLTTLRKRAISDDEIVSKSANGFRLANGETGVMLRNDGQSFYMLTTPSGQAQNGQWNTLRPFGFNLTSGRAALLNGVDIAGGAMISHNAGISTATTGPAPLIDGQVYDAAAVHTNFTSGNVTTAMLMGSRVVAGREDYGLLSYRDWQGNWNELQVRPNADLSVGQLTKRNQDGWFWAAGVRNTDDKKGHITNGLHIQGYSDLFADVFHYERIGQHHFMGLHVANGRADGWYEFRNDGSAFTNGAWHNSSDIRMKTDITQIDGALDKLAHIGGYTYLKQGLPEAGVIAQEVEEILPQSVTRTELKLNDGSVLKDARSININGVVALLVEALKEERSLREAERENFERRLAALEKGNERA
ncbi:tail fiber domain-containing protein [Erwinia tasmaniensis]|uniref:Klebicin C phage associated protein n=1 Tax=Erwinia tasmaniensis (strain DSM 17950 / CFBP 7177 / CIP 109463 / NCPPB 4357 / Et1/99) TaxID=465817 RepID=B2VB97_ERWT9|nr:tail fiber domain-containing protein [Erwinia tasmaniensis]CAO94993.1 Klebicin C phage associated protein [Erwinia tasmaniensis Et1/99]